MLISKKIILQKIFIRCIYIIIYIIPRLRSKLTYGNCVKKKVNYVVKVLLSHCGNPQQTDRGTLCDGKIVHSHFSKICNNIFHNTTLHRTINPERIPTQTTEVRAKAVDSILHKGRKPPHRSSTPHQLLSGRSSPLCKVSHWGGVPLYFIPLRASLTSTLW